MINYLQVQSSANRLVRLISLGAPPSLIEDEVKYLTKLMTDPTPADLENEAIEEEQAANQESSK